MSDKHTPGPWVGHIDKGNSGDWKYVVRTFKDYGSRIGKQVATVNPYLCDPDPFAREANLNLIAAAPELLEALRACHDVLLMDPKHEMGRARLMAEKALDKAEGG